MECLGYSPRLDPDLFSTVGQSHGVSPKYVGQWSSNRMTCRERSFLPRYDPEAGGSLTFHQIVYGFEETIDITTCNYMYNCFTDVTLQNPANPSFKWSLKARNLLASCFTNLKQHERTTVQDSATRLPSLKETAQTASRSLGSRSPFGGV